MLRLPITSFRYSADDPLRQSETMVHLLGAQNWLGRAQSSMALAEARQN